MRHPLAGDKWQEKLPPICTGCGYNLTGLTRQCCPECGQYVTWSEVRQNARDTAFALRQTSIANDICDLGLYVCLVGFVVLLGCWVADWADGPARVAAFFMGIGSFGCGVHVFRVGHFPAWVTEHLTDRPRYAKGATVALLASALIALVIFLP